MGAIMKNWWLNCAVVGAWVFLSLSISVSADHADGVLIFKNAKSYAVRINGELLATDGQDAFITNQRQWVKLPPLKTANETYSNCGLQLSNFTGIFSIAEDVFGNFYAISGYTECAYPPCIAFGAGGNCHLLRPYAANRVKMSRLANKPDAAWENKLAWEPGLPIKLAYDKNKNIYAAAGNYWFISDTQGVNWKTNQSFYNYKDRIFSDSQGNIYLALLGGNYVRGYSSVGSPSCGGTSSILSVNEGLSSWRDGYIPDNDYVYYGPLGYLYDCHVYNNSADLVVLEPSLIVDNKHAIYSANFGKSWDKLANTTGYIKEYLSAANGNIYGVAADGLYAIEKFNPNSLALGSRSPAFGQIIRKVASFEKFKSVTQVTVQENNAINFIGEHINGVAGWYQLEQVSSQKELQKTTLTQAGDKTQQSIFVDFIPELADLGKTGHSFISAEIGGVTYIKSGTQWLVPGISRSSIVVIPGFPAAMTMVPSRIILADKIDSTPLTGIKIKIGYGIGTTLKQTYADMLASGRAQLEFLIE